MEPKFERWSEGAGDDCLAAIVAAMAQADAALNLAGLLEPPRGSCALAWETVHGTLLKALNHAIEAMAFAERNCCAWAQSEGRQECSGCRRWIEPERMTKHEVGYSSKSEKSRNTYFTCIACHKET